MGELTAALERIKAEGLARHRAAFHLWVDDTTSRAMRHAREGGSHPFGTRTPAARGGGPAVVSGGLARSVGSVVISDGVEMEARVGPRDEPHEQPPRKTNRRTRGRHATPTAGQVGEYVEKMGFPFMEPTAREAEVTAEAIWRRTFEGLR